MKIDAYFDAVKDSALPGVWAKAMQLYRSRAVWIEKVSGDEVRARVKVEERPVHPTVQLWVDDQDGFCNCGAKTDICVHVAATVIYLKNEGAPVQSDVPKGATAIEYHFEWSGDFIHFSRELVWAGDREILSESLTSKVGGIQSGRFALPPILATQADYQIDALLQQGEFDEFSQNASAAKALSECERVFLNREPIQIQKKPYRLKLQLRDQGRNFVLERADLNDRFRLSLNFWVQNGAKLYAIERPEMLKFAQREYDMKDATRLAVDVLPRLEKDYEVEILTQRLPKFTEETVDPELVFDCEKTDTGALRVVPRVRYPGVGKAQIEKEQALIKKLREEYFWAVGYAREFQGDEAVKWLEKNKALPLKGPGLSAFQASQSEMVPDFDWDGENLDAEFDVGGEKISGAKVLQAYRENHEFIPLLSGVWANIPRDWFAKYGETLERILAAQAERGKLPPSRIPDLLILENAFQVRFPDKLAKLRNAFEHFEAIPKSKLPKDLKADLRPYQKDGVDWLAFLKNLGLGALLADDMGLGKTLQAICAIEGKTLIACPTSVLFSWRDQMAHFRPKLKVNLFHGQGRVWDENAQVILTSHALLRLELDRFRKIDWDLMIFDEAQSMKNSESLLAKSACSIPSKFKIALSGTPIENSVEELWSLFRWVEPELLPEKSVFKDWPLEEIQKRVRPLILRRKKNEVAKDLPPKTEVNLYCELSEYERKVYDSLLLTSREEVIQNFEKGGSILNALEMLLRVRQACCESSLVPGVLPPEGQSSKIQLLVEQLHESIENGHKTLVFSQWTQMLDRVEKALKNEKISFVRLDGSTPNREARVADFQKTDGPPVFLISLKAGGVGLTLTEADHVYLLDPWWNPAVEEQATDRAHRIGQKNPVWVYRIIARETVEEKILILQEKKRGIAQKILSATDEKGEIKGTLTRQDLLELLS